MSEKSQQRGVALGGRVQGRRRQRLDDSVGNFLVYEPNQGRGGQSVRKTSASGWAQLN